MAIRTIYQIDKYTTDGELFARRFARNKRTAERIAKVLDRNATQDSDPASILPVRRDDFEFVDPAVIESI